MNNLIQHIKATKQVVKLLSKEKLAEIARYATEGNINLYHQPLLKVMTRYEINTPLRMAHFLAQLIHESGSFKYSEEIASGAAYEGRKDLGNTQPGDGVRFKGRGLIQLTGRANYTEYDKVTGNDVIANPEIVGADPLESANAAGWFWDTRNLNELADADDVEAITKKINGGFNGLKDRKEHLAIAKKVLL